MDRMQEWLLTPNGMLFGKLVASATKIALFWISTKVPQLGLGPDIDKIVPEIAPVVALAVIGWWGKAQHDATMTKIDTALNTPCPKEGEPK